MEKFDIAEKKLNKELDIEDFIKTSRVSKLLHRFKLKKRQQFLVKYFRKFLIQNEDVLKRREDADDTELDDQIDKLEPFKNTEDKRIMFEITGKRLQEQDF